MLTLAALAVLAMVLVLGVLAWLMLHLREQQARIGAHIESLTRRSNAVAEPEPAMLLNLDAGKGRRAPAFELAALDGDRVSLDALLAPAKPLLLVFTAPTCGPCYETLPDLDGWQRVYGDRLAIALVSTGDMQTNLAMTSGYNIAPVLLQREQELIEAYALDQAPAAVVVHPDGTIAAGPRYGAKALRQLVAESLGLSLPAAPEHAIETVEQGQMAPAIRRPDLEGSIVDLAGPAGEPSIVLFWSPGCPHCVELQPQIHAFEQAPNHPRLVIVSRGPHGLNQAAGFASPVILDDDLSIARTFGVSGTPAAVLIDGQSMVAAPVARGSGRIGAILAGLPTVDAADRAAD